MNTEDKTLQKVPGALDPTDELRALRLQRDELIAAREAKQTPTPEQELAAAKQAVADERALNAAIDEHGAVDRYIAAVQTDLGLVIVKRASAGRFQRFQAVEKYTHEELYKLVSPSLVYPDRLRFDGMLDEQPAILVRSANAITRLAGVRGEEVSKK